ncbi:MAG: type II toxin-antitoxin system RelE/ParE family toxin [Alphaproteobacteria bacterium]|nr:type II toxin-antitoxin system RelE/ParE family toxin [Alphaproteobacteria bacterium]
MIYRVVFSPAAGSQLDGLYAYIAEMGGVQAAEGFVGGIHQHCLNLADFPHQGSSRKSADIPNLRTLPYKRRAVIAFTADDAAEVVTILGVFYGGRDYESYLGIETSDE